MKTRWYKDSIIYQIYPYSFMDSNGDGIGDINGIISKLDYIKELGATAIWLSPLYDSPDHDYGYDIRDYYQIAPHFGTMDDFKNLIEEAHKRDLKIIMDAVFNHTSNEHEWFKKALEDPTSEYRDYYIFKKGIKKGHRVLPPNNWTSSFTGSAWERVEGSDDFYLHLFTKEQPDLNWENPKVREEVANIFKFYLDMGVDGFRMDVFNVFSKDQSYSDTLNKKLSGGGSEYFVDGPRMHEFLHELNENVFSKYDSFVVGESFQSSLEEGLKYVSEENNEIDALFNFNHFKSDSKGGAAFLKKKFDILEFKDGLLTPQILDYSHGWHTLVVENHDVPRSVSRFGLNAKEYRKEAAKMLATILYMGFGIPFVYQGEEIGTSNHPFNSIDECMDPVSHFIYKILSKLPLSKKTKMKIISRGARDNARRPMQWDDSINGGFTTGTPWQKINDDYKEINVKNDLDDPDGVYHYYQKLLFIKRSNKAATYGKIIELNHEDLNTISYLRTNDQNNLLIVGNFKDQTVEYAMPEELKGLNLKPVLSNYDYPNVKGETITLKPYQAIIYEYTSYKTEFSYGAVIYRVNEKGEREYLVEKMALGHNSLTKGHIEVGERPYDCAMREIKEELGVEVELNVNFSHKISYYPAPGIRKFVTFYIATIKDNQNIHVDNKEVKGFEWLTLHDALEFITHESDKETIIKADKYIGEITQ